MGDRFSGIIGIEPPPPEGGSDGIVLPGVGGDIPGPVGLDAGTGTGGGPASLRLSGWPRDLTWDDFPEVSSDPDGIGEYAQISCEVTQPDQLSVQRQHGQLLVVGLSVNISIVRDQCWAVRGHKTPELLSHEQGHYNITGLTGRDMGNEIMAARAGTTDQLQTRITQIIQRTRERATALNERYDSETNHGINREAQQTWDDRISRSMRSGERFRP